MTLQSSARTTRQGVNTPLTKIVFLLCLISCFFHHVTVASSSSSVSSPSIADLTSQAEALLSVEEKETVHSKHHDKLHSDIEYELSLSSKDELDLDDEDIDDMDIHASQTKSTNQESFIEQRHHQSHQHLTHHQKHQQQKRWIKEFFARKKKKQATKSKTVVPKQTTAPPPPAAAVVVKTPLVTVNNVAIPKPAPVLENSVKNIPVSEVWFKVIATSQPWLNRIAYVGDATVNIRTVAGKSRPILVMEGSSTNVAIDLRKAYRSNSNIAPLLPENLKMKIRLGGNQCFKVSCLSYFSSHDYVKTLERVELCSRGMDWKYSDNLVPMSRGAKNSQQPVDIESKIGQIYNSCELMIVCMSESSWNIVQQYMAQVRVLNTARCRASVQASIAAQQVADGTYVRTNATTTTTTTTTATATATTTATTPTTATAATSTTTQQTVNNLAVSSISPLSSTASTTTITTTTKLFDKESMWANAHIDIEAFAAVDSPLESSSLKFQSLSAAPALTADLPSAHSQTFYSTRNGHEMHQSSTVSLSKSASAASSSSSSAKSTSLLSDQESMDASIESFLEQEI